MMRGVENRVTLAFAAAIVAIGIATVLAWHSMNASLASSRAVDHTYRSLTAQHRAVAMLNEIAAAAADYVLNADAASLERREAAISEYRSAIQDLRELTADDPLHQQRLRSLETLSRERIELMNTVIIERQMEGFEAARRMLADDRGRTLLAEIRSMLGDIEQTERRRLTERAAAEESTRGRVVTSIAVLLALVVVTIAVGVLRLRRELTERREAERRIQALNEDLEVKAAALESANKELESFSYSVSHDLRAPLRAIDGFSLMLEEDFGQHLDAEARRYIRVIRDSTAKMGRLIEDLLAFSRLSRQPLNLSPVDTRALVARAASEVLDGHAGRKPDLVVGELPTAHGDPALLHQVWVNLIGNAVKYSSKVDAPRVEVGGRANGSEATYYVRDNGAGFDMAYADKLFGVFQRLHREEEFPGTGVGLAIVQRVVGRHGGRVWAESEPDRGAHFYFTLPMQAAT